MSIKVIDTKENTERYFGHDVERLSSYLFKNYFGKIARVKIGGKELQSFKITNKTGRIFGRGIK